MSKADQIHAQQDGGEFTVEQVGWTAVFVILCVVALLSICQGCRYSYYNVQAPVTVGDGDSRASNASETGGAEVSPTLDLTP